MKKYLLPKGAKAFKANLHCHTTVSDGKLSPLEVKELYKSQGYSVVAYTDHDTLIAHPELRDEDFLPLNGYEIQITENDEGKPGYARRTCHLCMIGIEPDNLVQKGYHRERYTKDCNRPFVRFNEDEPDFERIYTPECINGFIKKAREAGFFVTYNHPTWSLESYPEYSRYEGMNAMEIVNYSSRTLGYEEYNPRVYDELLRMGKRIFAVAADDNHNNYPFGNPRCDSCGGFTFIMANSLDYREVTEALVKGNFYASTGPEIHSLVYEDGKVAVKTSEAANIAITYVRGACITYAGDEPLTYASFRLLPDGDYFRITVTDKYGRRANTRAYFFDELVEE